MVLEKWYVKIKKNIIWLNEYMFNIFSQILFQFNSWTGGKIQKENNQFSENFETGRNNIVSKNYLKF